MHTEKDIQRRLTELNYYSGPIDGLRGRMTIEGIKRFQEEKGLNIKFPGTVGAITLTALFGEPAGKPVDINQITQLSRPWFDLALRKKGLHEGRDYETVRKFLKSDGKTLGDPRKLPWCGDFVETCISLSLPDEPMIENPYLARNWNKFGQAVKPTTGCIATFWRGKKTGPFGHVCFLAGEGKQEGTEVYYCLGGNQGNTISIVAIKKSRLLETRWPVTYDMPVVFSLLR